MPERLDKFLEGVGSSLLLNAIFYALPTGACIFGEDRSSMYVNEKFCEIFGYDCRMLQKYDRVSILPRAVVTDISERYSDLLEVPAEQADILQVETRDGRQVQLRVKVTEFEYPEDGGFRIVSVEDVTEMMRTIKLEEDAERIMHHDLKNIVDSMGNAARLVGLRGEVGGEQQKYLDYITDSADKACELIDGVREIFLMEEGLYETEQEEFDLNDIFEKLEMRNRHFIEERGIDFDVTYRGGPARENRLGLRGEKRLIERMFGNVLRNAFEAVHEGGKVRVFIDEVGEKARVVVRSESVVPAAMRDRFFEKYATTKQYGTGLGNYTARLIARAHGGDVSVEHGPDRDTDVIIELPTE
jgi:PAS domain S-box-containing protein